MCKIDIEFSSDSRQCPIGSIEQCVCGAVILNPEPFSLKDTPQGFRYIELRTIWRQKEKEEPSLFPYWPKFSHEFAPVYLCIIQYDERILGNAKGESVEEVGYFIGCNAFVCGKAIITVVRSIMPKILSLPAF